MPKFINEILLISSIIAGIGLIYIVYSRGTKNISVRLYIMTMILIIGYLISHGIHFLYIKAGDLIILDQSCHSFLLLILLSLTFFALYFPNEIKLHGALKISLLVPSLVMFFGIWGNWFLLESHTHSGKYEAHYTAYYPIFIGWYAFLLFFNIVLLAYKYVKNKNQLQKRQIVLFFVGLIFTNIIAASFGLILPWLLGFYYLVEISPASFITGVIIFTTLGISRYNLFPVVSEKLHSFSIIKKVVFSALVIVPIIIILFQIPLGRVVLGVDNSDMWQKYFMLSLVSGVLVSATMTFVIVKIIADPINKLKEKAEEIQKGKFGTLVSFHSSDEIGELAETFNAMSLKLKEDADELQKQQTHISLLLKAIEYSNAGICILNGDYKIIEANQKFFKFHSGNRELKKGDPILQLYQKIMLDEDFETVKSSLELKQNVEKEIPVNCADGCRRILLVSITNFLLYDETPAFIIVEVDITDIKLLERQLFESEKLAELGKMAAVLAHEIKTPLTSIKMNVDIISSGNNISEENFSSFRIINREVNRLDKLAKEVLQYARQTELNYSDVNIRDLVDEVIANSIPNGKQIKILNRLASRIILADREKLYQVFNNLITNSQEAIEESGIIRIYDIDEGDSLKVFVEDNGKGIPEKDKQIIFNPFITFKASGTGLGLAIAKKIMEQHNFKLNLEYSEKGKTIFCLNFKKSK